MGVEASNELHIFAYEFARKLNAAANGIGMTAPEAMGFRKAWENLRDEVAVFMNLIVCRIQRSSKKWQQEKINF